jgi:hypothetical protein
MEACFHAKKYKISEKVKQMRSTDEIESEMKRLSEEKNSLLSAHGRALWAARDASCGLANMMRGQKAYGLIRNRMGVVDASLLELSAELERVRLDGDDAK